MISNVRKHKEKSKLSDKFPQPFCGPGDSVLDKIAKMSKTQKKFKKRK